MLLPTLIALIADANRRLDLDEFRVAIPLLNVSHAAAAEDDDDDADDDDDDDADDDDADDDDDDDDDDATAANAAAAADQHTSQMPLDVDIERLFGDLDGDGSGFVR